MKNIYRFNFFIVPDASYKKDNLFTESGSLKDITSEYTRCFRAPPIATYSLGDLTDEPKVCNFKLLPKITQGQCKEAKYLI